MFTLDFLVLDLIKQLYNKIFPWNDSALYGFGSYAKWIITLFFFQQCLNGIYASKTKKKSGENK